MTEYRIVTDRFNGFEVQFRRWWWPFWTEADFSNTHTSVERAEAWARAYASGTLVKYLGRL